MSKSEQLQKLHSQCKKCTKCRLRQGATQVVPGDGNPEAEIMFIGEGPGANEDKKGIPFCGAAGNFLDELLASIDLKREEVFIGNMVKCRPPGNRDPQEDEIEACRPWLDKQIKIIDPKIFVPLGRYSMAKFLPNVKISEVHGKAYERGGKLYFVMYHPAVALYKNSFREVMLEDMKGLRRILDGDRSEVFTLEDEVEEIKKLLKKSSEEKAEERKAQMELGL